MTVLDDDVAAIQLSPRNLMLDAGQQGSYSVRLATEPTGDVLVELIPGVGVNVAPTDCTTEESDTPCLLFTRGTRHDAQTVTLSSESDDLGRVNDDGVSSDAGYDGRVAIHGERR